MAKGNDTKGVFPLTSLQIGDLQSYLSDLSLFLADESNKLYILVDNRPWLRDLDSRPTHLWQLMVTKSRLSPFAITKTRKARKEGKDTCPDPGAVKSEQLKRWFSLVDAATLSRKRVLLPVKTLRSPLLCSELRRILYGFIVFEVSWSDVRGINYLNELQTDTSLAIEAKYMQRWEFDSIVQAANCMSSWFSGTLSERLQLKEYLDSAIGEVFYDAEEDLTNPASEEENVSNENQGVGDAFLHCLSCGYTTYDGTTQSETSEPHTPPPTGPYKRRRVTKRSNDGVEVDMYTEEAQSINESSSYNSETCSTDSGTAAEATEYRDVLILFRFDDRDLPFKLKQVIMSDLRLLTLLEAGLPSWVIFLQSYPVFCHLYRPWMCPLARALYVLISFVTVLIGFYDLYKNVPVLKATASRLCGPLLDWIETWEMVSRIKYLGTMLFLHNFQKAVRWFLAVTRATKSFFSVIAQPLGDVLSFLHPLWNFFVQVTGSFGSGLWVLIGTSCNLVEDLIEIILLPLWLIWKIATSVVYPMFWMLWELLYAPIRIVLALASFVAFVSTCVYEVVGDLWRVTSGIFRLASASEAAVTTTVEVSMWRSLWNDLFSQIFRAVRSILNGFVAFFTACNRHRLSIYNHIERRLLGRTPGSTSTDSRHRRSIRKDHNQLEGRRKIH